MLPELIKGIRTQTRLAISQGITKFKSIAIVSPLGAKPCGPCRQIIHEYLGEIPIYIGKNNSKCGRLGTRFQIVGRAKEAEIRGCGDLMEEKMVI